MECLSIEIWVDDFPICVVTAYGPQLGDKLEKKQKFWGFIQREAQNEKNHSWCGKEYSRCVCNLS